MTKEDDLSNMMQKEFSDLEDVITSFTTHENYLNKSMKNLEEAVNALSEYLSIEEFVNNQVMKNLLLTWFDCLEAVVLCADDLEGGLRSEANIAGMLLIKNNFLESSRKVLNNESGSTE